MTDDAFWGWEGCPRVWMTLQAFAHSVYFKRAVTVHAESKRKEVSDLECCPWPRAL